MYSYSICIYAYQDAGELQYSVTPHNTQGLRSCRAGRDHLSRRRTTRWAPHSRWRLCSSASTRGRASSKASTCLQTCRRPPSLKKPATRRASCSFPALCSTLSTLAVCIFAYFRVPVCITRLLIFDIILNYSSCLLMLICSSSLCCCCLICIDSIDLESSCINLMAGTRLLLYFQCSLV